MTVVADRAANRGDTPEALADHRDRSFAPNVRPAVPADLRSTWLACWDAIEALALGIMSAAAAAVALDLEADHFVSSLSSGR